jgi:hypothetical protein
MGDVNTKPHGDPVAVIRADLDRPGAYVATFYVSAEKMTDPAVRKLIDDLCKAVA